MFYEKLKLNKLSKDEKITCFAVLRFFLYFIFLLCLIISFTPLTNYFQEKTFEEYGPIENLQLICLVLTTLVFLFSAIRLKKDKYLLFVLSSLCALASCRELDVFFEKLIPIISWKFGWCFPISALVFCFRNLNSTKESLFYFLKTPSFYLMFSAFLVSIPIAQSFGHKPLIQTVLGNNVDARSIRRFLEEGLELIGYLILMLSSFECFLNFNDRKK